MRTDVSKKQMERVCRMYRTNSDAGKALGINPSSVARICKRHGLVSPSQKNKKPPRGKRKPLGGKLHHVSGNLTGD